MIILLEYVNSASSQEDDDGKRKNGFDHHEQFGYSREWLGICRAESRCAGECQEHVIDKVRHPTTIASRRVLWKEKVCGLRTSQVAFQRATAVDFKIPQGKNQEIEHPEDGC